MKPNFSSKTASPYMTGVNVIFCIALSTVSSKTFIFPFSVKKQDDGAMLIAAISCQIIASITKPFRTVITWWVSAKPSF